MVAVVTFRNKKRQDIRDELQINITARISDYRSMLEG
jgi:hypothetical protein